MMANPLVLSQHTEDAAFHWLLRDAAVGEPHYSLADLAKLDTRLDAHLDGLRIAADAGWTVVKEELKWEEAGEVFTGLCLALESGDPLRIEEVLAVADPSLELARGAISALAWVEPAAALPVLKQLAESENPVRRRMAVGALAVTRTSPGDLLTRFVREDEPVVRARALKAVGELGRRDLLNQCVGDLQAEDDECRYRAAWSGALLGDGSSLVALRTFVVPDGPHAESAAELIARRLDRSRSLRWHQQLAGEAELLRVAAQVAGAIGDPVLVPWLLQLMRTPELARVAGEALTRITGVDLAFEDLDGDAPEGVEAGPTEEAGDEDVAMDPDEDLPFPAPERVEAWWRQHGARFPEGVRHLNGQPISPPALVDVLRTGMQRQRRAAALELAALDGSRPLFEVRARGDRQLRLLGL
jgi:uncharacterized protein (TIGR02270 family)